MKKFLCAASLCFCSLVVCAALALAADGKALYAKCAGCHGADGSKKTMGDGNPIKGMKADVVVKALEGYKAKTFGGAKKAVMEGQMGGLSAEDIKALGEYIATF